ncbi:MAG: ATP synthase subunit b [Parcubacteria group bacterium GW2011_GWB1_44_7]|nr:MAG: ATP synthase subunit b [Parcubacteria group bacterium GW2011_GWB1_44_7]
MGKLLSELGINWKILIAQLINFGILVAVLRWLLYRPLLELLEKRRKKLEDDADRAERLEQKIKATAIEEEKTLAEARKRGQEILAATEKTGKELKESLTTEAKREAEKMIAAGRQILKEDQNKLRRELKQEIGATVALAIEHSLGDVLNKEIQEKLEKGTIERVKQI